jgi:hypothetical protein
MTPRNPNAPEEDLSLSNNPFIWGNIALLAGVPWLLALSMAGLAVGDPVFPEWFEIFILGFPAIALAAWVQWQKPISPFSLWLATKPSESLSDRDRQILTLVKQHSNGWYVTGWIATAVAIFMSAIFCKIYVAAPLAQAIEPFPAGLRLFGIVWAEIFFLLSNILLQAGISALRIKLTAESDLNGLKPFAVEKIKNSFTSIGWQSPQILKFFEEDVAIADKTKDLIAEPVNFVEDSEFEESLDLESTEIISEPEIETIPHEEIVQEPEGLEPIEFLAPEIEALDITDTSSASEIEPETNPEVDEVSSDDDFVEEVEELEISAIVADESVIETISEPEVEQFVEVPLTETILNPEIFQETEELNPFALVADEKSAIDSVSDSTESSLNKEIAEEAKELEAFETTKEPDLIFLEIPELELDEVEQTEANLELSDNVLEEQFTEDNEELESLETSFETVEDAEDASTTTTSSDQKRSLDFLKRSHKTGGSQKIQGFGKSIKRDVVSIPDTVDTDSVKVKEPDAIATQDLEATEIKTQDFDDELDELVAFNAYVENILREYLEENEEEAKDKKVLNEEIPKPVNPSIVFDPAIEAIAIAKEIVEAFTENLPDLETQVPAEITEEISSNEQAPQDPEYLVQELLFDKFFARIEELNVDKANKVTIEQTTEQTTENISNPNPEIDEFADLEALLDRKYENSDPENLSDRNS